MESYECLLDEAYGKVKVVKSDSERFEVPKVSGMVSGKNTIITNLAVIASYIRRPVEHLAKFLQKELASYGKLDNGRLILLNKLSSDKVNDKIQMYTKELVICPECKKPDTEIKTENGVKYKHCLACGAKSPVK